jgi:hypothetical protein
LDLFFFFCCSFFPGSQGWILSGRAKRKEKSRESSGGEKNKTNHRAPRKRSKRAPLDPRPRLLLVLLFSTQRSWIKYTQPSRPMASLMSPPLLAETVVQFHSASTPISCSGSAQRCAITGLPRAGRGDRYGRRKPSGRRGLRVAAVAAESRSSEGGVAEDYYAVLGVVRASSSKRFFFLSFVC